MKAMSLPIKALHFVRVLEPVRSWTAPGRSEVDYKNRRYHSN